MKCTCGDVMTVDAASREEAVEKLKGIMNEEAIAKHFAEKHVGEQIPSVEQSNEMIEQNAYQQPQATAM